METNARTISIASQKVLDFIDSSIAGIVNEFQVRPCGRPLVKLRHVTQLTPAYNERGVLTNWHIQDREVSYFFPGQTRDEAWRFTCVLRIFDEIHSAVTEGVVITKRDIFYRDPTLFVKQAVVDRYVDDIAHTCNVARADLNVVASPKGLIAGLRTDDSDESTEMVPATGSIHTKSLFAHLQWILVVEKEATFKFLVQQKVHRNVHLGHGLLVTAKGYPDLATRRFLRSVLDHPDFNGPIFGLVDYDPYGIDILRSYRFGSKTTASNVNVAIPEMEWVGLQLDAVLRQGLHEPLISLTEVDRQKAQHILCWLHAQTPNDHGIAILHDCRVELERMLMINKKAEIQVLQNTAELCKLVKRTISESLSAI